jgi:hypothetical protein
LAAESKIELRQMMARLTISTLVLWGCLAAPVAVLAQQADPNASATPNAGAQPVDPNGAGGSGANGGTPPTTPSGTAAQDASETTAPALSGEALVRATVAQAVGDQANSRAELRNAETSESFHSNGKLQVCANVDAVNSRGSAIGMTYLAITLSDDGSEVVEVKDVTGTLHRCYGAKYDKFKELRSYDRK